MLMRTKKTTPRLETCSSTTNTTLENAEKILFNKISNRFASTHAAFRSFCDGGESVLSTERVRRMMDTLACVRIDRNDLNMLVRKMGSGGPIKYHVFRKYIDSLSHKFHGHQKISSSSDTKTFVDKRGITSSNAFANGSNQNDGNVITNRPTIRVIDPPCARTTISIFGEADSGRSENSMRKHQRRVPSHHHHHHHISRTTQDINQIQDLILEKLKQKYRSPSQAFLKFDRQRCGFITLQKFRMVLEHNGIQLSDEHFHTLSRRFDRDGNNKISYQEFVRQVSTPPSSHFERQQQEEIEAQSLKHTQAKEKSLEYRNELMKMIEEKKRRKEMEKERIRRLEEKEEREAANYNPWGRGGCGAPLRDSAGNVLANFQTRGGKVDPHNTSFSSLNADGETRQEKIRKYQEQQQQKQQQHRVGTSGEDSPLRHARFRFEDLPSHQQEAIQSKNEKMLQWQRDLKAQVELKNQMKEREAARIREEERKEHIRLERQRAELEQKFQVESRNGLMKKEKQEDDVQNARSIVRTPRREKVQNTLEEQAQSPLIQVPIQQQYEEEELSLQNRRIPKHERNDDASFLASLEQRHEDALERQMEHQQRAFYMSYSSPQRSSPPQQQTFSRIGDDQQIKSTSSMLYSNGQIQSFSPKLSSYSIGVDSSTSGKSASDMLMDFVKRREMWSST